MTHRLFRYLTAACLLTLFCLAPLAVRAQSLSLDELPGYDRVREIRKVYSQLKRGSVSNLHWSADGQTLWFSTDGERRQLNLKTGTISAAENEPQRPAAEGRGRGARRGNAGRARQRTWINSPDNHWKARYKDHNIQLVPLDAEGEPAGEPVPVTSEGTEKHRFGTACWVYGEELDQNDAMWFSPDSGKLAFYEIDEGHMQTYYLTTGNTALYTSLHKEQYPTAGKDNPHVKLHVYDLESGQTVTVNVDGPVDQYIYRIRFSPDGKELLFHRTNRWQNHLDVMAADVETGDVRTVVSETQETWQNNAPLMQFLEDGQRFVWETEKTGWKQFELRHLDGRLLASLTPEADYPVHRIVQIDEPAGWFYYSAFSDENPLDLQLHRSRLDGEGTSPGARLTPPGYHYSQFNIAPDHSGFLASRETIDQPATIAAFDMQGSEIAELSAGSNAAFAENDLPPGELFSFTSADGKETIYGTLFKPRNFDPDKQYPLLIDVYGGPLSTGVTNRFMPGNPYCELGFVIAKIGNRGTINRGKAFESANYRKLGITDLDDQAAGVRHLAQLPWVDGERVGIYGHSYGGYMSALALLRYPGLFHVGVSGAPVTDWKNYDTIYTERYMRTPKENPEGYKAGSCIEHADALTGKLFILHGLVDDNVHPSNTWQLVEALQQAGKRFDLMVYPNNAHGFPYEDLKWEYLVRHLQPEPAQ